MPPRPRPPNFVAYPPQGLVLALQYWEGDEAAAMRLARLLADIEPDRRDDVTLAFCRRFDLGMTPLAYETMLYCGRKFPFMMVHSRRDGTGHPDGCNELWSGTMEQLSTAWASGNLGSHSVFTMEADGVPICKDWIDRLKDEHARTLAEGKRVTGPLTERPVSHINGSLIAHLSLWIDRPSLHRTPSGQAWDLFHAAALMSEARPTEAIRNVYGSKCWKASVLEPLSHEIAWIANAKDDSALEWAEKHLVHRRRPARLRAVRQNVVGRVTVSG